jgi:hypothetical protein
MNEVDAISIIHDVSPSPLSENEASPLPPPLTPEMKQQLWQMGEILPHTNSLSQVIEKIAGNVGIPPEISTICLDSDTATAFFSSTNKCIVFSKGLAKTLIEQGLSLTEDHLAAIIAHEITHQDTNERINGDYSFIRTSKLHSEEYRADREGMLLMAEAGYNPHGMIEVFQALGLTQGRHDNSHPEIIERIRHLERSLADDIHPIPNTTKEFQALLPEVISFIQEDSRVYDETEALLSLSSHELENHLLQTTTQAEFWKYYRQERHARRVEYARTLATHPELSQIVRKAILYKVISNSGQSPLYFLNGELQPTLERSAQQTIKEITGQTERHTPNSNYYSAFTVETSHDNAFLDSLPYRLGLPPGSIDSATNTAFHSRCVETNTALDNMITQQLDALTAKSLPASYHRFLTLVEQQVQDPATPLSPDIMATAFNLLDRSIAEADLARNNQVRTQHGLRLEGTKNGPFVDFDDPSQYQKTLDAAALSTAIELLEVIPENPAAQAHLETILIHEAQLNREEAHLLQEYIFHKNESHWFDYLTAVPRAQLIPLNQKIIQISLNESPSRLSTRAKCTGWLASETHLAYPNKHLSLNHASDEIMLSNHNFRAHPFRYPP